MKQPTVPQLTDEEQVAVHVIRTLCALEGATFVTAKDAYDTWLHMEPECKNRMWQAWHLFTQNRQN